MGFRYLWRESPCLYKKCPVYTLVNEIPAGPYVSLGIFGHGRKTGPYWIKKIPNTLSRPVKIAKRKAFHGS